MPGDPHSGSKVWKAPDREIGKPGENRGEIIAHRNLQPAAAFHDRENRCNLRSCLWAAYVSSFFDPEPRDALCVAWALTTLFLWSFGHCNTSPAIRTGVLVRRLRKCQSKRTVDRLNPQPA